MRAAVVEDWARGPRFGEFREPEAEAGEVLVTVEAAAISQLARSQASGRHYAGSSELPMVPGVDGVGRLQGGERDGERVYFVMPRAPFGAMAARTVVRREMCVAVPEGLPTVEAAALANPAMSSWAALTRRTRLEPGQGVLVHGATGASGRLALQIAKHLGAGRVVATGRNAASVHGLEAWGADATVPLDLPAEELGERLRAEVCGHGVDVILDYLWGEAAESLLPAVVCKAGGSAARRVRWVQVGSLSGTHVNLPAAVLRSSGLELMGSGIGSVAREDLVGSIAEALEVAREAGFKVETEAAPLREEEEVWGRKTSKRVVLTV